MPLFIDIHVLPGVSIEDVKMGHIADKATQDKYGVKYHQFWVNEESGTVFCLMEGPDKESCAATHREAHGNVACKIEEVSEGFFEYFMQRKAQVDGGLVLNPDGTVDNAFRYVLAISIFGNTKLKSNRDFKELLYPIEPNKFARAKIDVFEGKQLKPYVDDTIVGIFRSANRALTCAGEIQRELAAKSGNPELPEWDVTFKMGVGCSMPLSETEGFFERALKLAERLSLIAENGEILMSDTLKSHADPYVFEKYNSSFRLMGTTQEKFLTKLFNIAEEKISSDRFSVQQLGEEIGVSRPQLYRKVHDTTGVAPNGFLRNLKMHRALALLRKNEMTITQIAMEVGYSNPSYFAKCFRETYGVAPSQMVA